MQTREAVYAFDVPKRPFLRGVARLLDFSGSLDREYRKRVLEFYSRRAIDKDDTSPQSDEQAWQSAWKRDAEAIGSDWRAVGDYLRWAAAEIENELPDETRA